MPANVECHAFLFIEKRWLHIMEPVIVTKFLYCLLLKKPTPEPLKKSPQCLFLQDNKCLFKKNKDKKISERYILHFLFWWAK